MDYVIADVQAMARFSMPDAFTATGQIIDFKTSAQRGDDMIDAMRAQADFYSGQQWPIYGSPRRGKSVTQGGMLWNDFKDMSMHKLPTDEYRWARALSEAMRVPSSYYADAPPEVKRERERVLEYLAQFDTHQGRRAAAVVAKRVQFVLEGVEPKPWFDINKVRESVKHELSKHFDDILEGRMIQTMIHDEVLIHKKKPR